MAYMMRNEVDFEVDLGSYIGLLRGDGAGRQTSARGKGWHGSGGTRELAHAKKNDHSIASLAARPVGLTLRLRPRGECYTNVVNACKW